MGWMVRGNLWKKSLRVLFIARLSLFCTYLLWHRWCFFELCSKEALVLKVLQLGAFELTPTPRFCLLLSIAFSRRVLARKINYSESFDKTQKAIPHSYRLIAFDKLRKKCQFSNKNSYLRAMIEPFM